MKTHILAFTAVLTGIAVTAGQEVNNVQCKMGWTRYQGKCYHFSGKVADPDAARAECRRIHPDSDLPSIGSKKEQDFIINNLVDDGVGDNEGSVFIGATDAESKDTPIWTWSDGRHWGYSNWHIGEPNNNGAEHCAAMWEARGWQWNDVRCYRGPPAPLVCSYDLGPSTPDSVYVDCDNNAASILASVNGTGGFSCTSDKWCVSGDPSGPAACTLVVVTDREAVAEGTEGNCEGVDRYLDDSKMAELPCDSGVKVELCSSRKRSAKTQIPVCVLKNCCKHPHSHPFCCTCSYPRRHCSVIDNSRNLGCCFDPNFKGRCSGRCGREGL